MFKEHIPKPFLKFAVTTVGIVRNRIKDNDVLINAIWFQSISMWIVKLQTQILCCDNQWKVDLCRLYLGLKLTASVTTMEYGLVIFNPE